MISTSEYASQLYIVILCGGAKLTYAAPAADLYVGS